MAKPHDFIILIADEHAQTVDSLSLVLDNEGFNTIKAYNAEDALDIAQERKPNLVILHLHIDEELNGLEIAKKLSGIKILFTDALDGYEAKAGKCKNCIGLIKKPIDNDELVEVVKKALKI